MGRQTTARTLIQGSDGGFTAYLGAPSSEVRLRVYDKGVESHTAPPGQLWRWELQARREHARALCRGLDAAPVPAAFIDGAIAAHCNKLGVLYPAAPDTVAHVYDIARSSSNALDTLRWLETSVRPAIAKLLQYYAPEHILTALGVAGPVGTAFPKHPESGGIDGSR